MQDSASASIYCWTTSCAESTGPATRSPPRHVVMHKVEARARSNPPGPEPPVHTTWRDRRARADQVEPFNWSNATPIPHTPQLVRPIAQ